MLTETLENLIRELDGEIARLTRLRAEARSALGKDKVPGPVATPVPRKRRRLQRSPAEKALASQRMKDAWARRKRKQDVEPASDTTAH